MVFLAKNQEQKNYFFKKISPKNISLNKQAVAKKISLNKQTSNNNEYFQTATQNISLDINKQQQRRSLLIIKQIKIFHFSLLSLFYFSRSTL
ncbi:hypothetical protein CJP74_04285 [Psittacicella melopsittaci]|uniref:Uncharacterized protein n=1 Tax=Psittacicella melopsittaci TaxID=2028576 RepID=A0A3A1Y510_9GAMM|nr:hypothetical protein CJP74_04285 [Psittacicella melopsittaci]